MVPIHTLLAIAALKPDKKPAKIGGDHSAELRDRP